MFGSELVRIYHCSLDLIRSYLLEALDLYL